jgi:hypothetical protein
MKKYKVLVAGMSLNASEIIERKKADDASSLIGTYLVLIGTTLGLGDRLRTTLDHGATPSGGWAGLA